MSQFEHSIICPVDTPPFRDGLPSFMEDGGYRIKDEFHLTIADSAYRQTLSPEQLERFEELLKANPLPIIYEDTLYTIEKPKHLRSQTYERHSIVAPLKPGKILERLGEIASELEIATPMPFPHITIATAPDNPYAQRGIGISSVAEWIGMDPQIYLEGWMKHE